VCCDLSYDGSLRLEQVSCRTSRLLHWKSTVFVDVRASGFGPALAATAVVLTVLVLCVHNGRNWVSQARLRAGKLNSTVTMCDDEPPSWLLPFPPAVQPAGVSLDTCRAQDITTMFHLAAAHGCCYQFNPHTQRDRGHSDAEQWALPTQADLGVSLA